MKIRLVADGLFYFGVGTVLGLQVRLSVCPLMQKEDH